MAKIKKLLAGLMTQSGKMKEQFLLNPSCDTKVKSAKERKKEEYADSVVSARSKHERNQYKGEERNTRFTESGMKEQKSFLVKAKPPH